LPSLQDHPFNLKMTIAILADSSQFVERLPQFLSSSTSKGGTLVTDPVTGGRIGSGSATD